MNYRHGFHAGNFADLAKHAAVLSFLKHLRGSVAPLTVIDTHAGAGYYDLSDPHFARSKEAEAGIKYLLSSDVPDSLKPLAGYVRAKNERAGFRDSIGLYPGSPVLTLDHLRVGDAYVGCELRPDDFRYLQEAIVPRGKAQNVDGYKFAVNAAQIDDPADMFWLIDPPFERSDDYTQIVDALKAGLTARPSLSALIWLPLKDLETFDRYLRDMEHELFAHEDSDGETHEPDLLIAELRLRPLWNPMKMNGCALVAVNAPVGFEADLRSIAADVVTVFGDKGGLAKVWTLNS
ncbi:23S rRNA (adenine(2030)-N(6))-methyltransferase RlmJ [Asticcacaulis sp. SL142]|uniref:23S rRNA (adenine(2030)-N(6))-methyltransferase RlmJ n=1 Tax=Asticcacaulis sp. SL142 TaxID=2995155 RepID=UPI00226CB903|nr:23S rRNA (adenine(2030)-N(6))-methyltransferase RlmJ [Asticcacaulis sp. SL142]WAC48146.1 23S rRNA (adenine(2030)-N(6))-methyltransferase RlmJ [Asticcacaulis sp. SL142]